MMSTITIIIMMRIYTIFVVHIRMNIVGIRMRKYWGFFLCVQIECMLLIFSMAWGCNYSYVCFIFLLLWKLLMILMTITMRMRMLMCSYDVVAVGFLAAVMNYNSIGWTPNTIRFIIYGWQVNIVKPYEEVAGWITEWRL